MNQNRRNPQQNFPNQQQLNGIDPRQFQQYQQQMLLRQNMQNMRQNLQFQNPSALNPRLNTQTNPLNNPLRSNIGGNRVMNPSIQNQQMNVVNIPQGFGFSGVLPLPLPRVLPPKDDIIFSADQNFQLVSQLMAYGYIEKREELPNMVVMVLQHFENLKRLDARKNSEVANQRESGRNNEGTM